MNIKDYQRTENAKIITFESITGYTVEFTIRDDGDISLEAQHVSIEEMQQCIKIIESGKLVISL